MLHLVKFHVCLEIDNCENENRLIGFDSHIVSLFTTSRDEIFSAEFVNSNTKVCFFDICLETTVIRVQVIWLKNQLLRFDDSSLFGKLANDRNYSTARDFGKNVIVMEQI